MAHEDANDRIESLKQVVMDLQDGRSVDEVRAKFRDVISGVTAQEISQMEQALINDGISVEDVQRLCDVHAAVFRDELEKAPEPSRVPGHPVHTFLRENRAIERLLDGAVMPAVEAVVPGAPQSMSAANAAGAAKSGRKTARRVARAGVVRRDAHGAAQCLDVRVSGTSMVSFSEAAGACRNGRREAEHARLGQHGDVHGAGRLFAVRGGSENDRVVAHVARAGRPCIQPSHRSLRTRRKESRCIRACKRNHVAIGISRDDGE